jgi:hypothetical protein
MWLRAFVWGLYPQCNELIYDNYNAVAFGWSPTDRVGHTFCSIAVGRSSHNVHFGFYWGSKIEDPVEMLLGKGNQYRYILVGQLGQFPEAYMRVLLGQAYQYSCGLVKDPKLLKSGLTILKSVSEKKRAGKK